MVLHVYDLNDVYTSLKSKRLTLTNGEGAGIGSLFFTRAHARKFFWT